ncbi:urea transporter [Streptomyces sp. LaBMicrA B280]|uniref:urea transporter n=1 Tax=Streptomyces sp. LaBMicrA B280 TaxID=3391001 RepID=UPI003BA5337E
MPAAGQAVRPMGPGPIAVGRASLHGIAQVTLSANPWTGLLFLAALFADDRWLGGYGLLGTLVSTGAAAALRTARDGRLGQGLEGYCGCLVGIALLVRLGASWRTALLVVLAAAVCSILTAAAVRLLGLAQLPVLTAPYCLVASVLAMALPSNAAAAPTPVAAATGVSMADLGHAFCDNIGQVFFLDKWYAGLIVLAGLLVTSWRAAVVAACGSAVAVLTAWAMGLPADRIAEGLYGYNAVLVAIALAATFLTPTRWTTGYAVLAAVASVPLTTAWTAVVQPSGGSPFTWPFVVTTWLFLAAAPAMDRPGMPYEKAK